MNLKLTGSLLAVLLIPAFGAGTASAGGPQSANGGCGNGQATGNQHCGGGPKLPTTNLVGVQVSQTQDRPTQVGGVIPDPHNTVLTPLQPQPAQPPAQQTPTPMAVVTPPQVLPPQKTPMLVPPQPPAQQTPTPMAVVTPPQVPQSGQRPVQGPLPQAAQGGVQIVADGGHGHALLVHAPDTPKPVTSGRVAVDGVYSLEYIEPGLQSRKVKVYRTRDAAEQIYKDTIPLDQGGFQVIVVGARNPDYVH